MKAGNTDILNAKVLDIENIREQFPILDQKVNGKPLIYFDNAASSQKPQRVIDALQKYYAQDHSNIHRGIHTLAERATQAYEDTRIKAKAFVNANEPAEIIFTKGTTESLNLVASSYGKKFINPGDQILVTTMEHHSNIVPWQLLCQQTGAELKVIPISQTGEVRMSNYEAMLSEKVKIVSIVHASNSLGTINPIKRMIELAHGFGAVVAVDGAQAAPHLPIDVQDLDCDFYALSAHKMYGPTGVGLLYGKRQWLEAMPPYQGGGEMIKQVSFETTTYNDIPHKFEAGTPNIADVVAFSEAIGFVEELGKPAMAAYEKELLTYAHQQLSTIEGFSPIGTATQKVSVVSFLIDGIHPYDLGVMLDAKGIAVRTGHH
ncbi:MAG: aminotransferase class V-fold PLP-dependent enzyme, partial [Cyclobacteriaceae bacterium]